jgi:alpha-beta hydrolase superfamily lysophospholipase
MSTAMTTTSTEGWLDRERLFYRCWDSPEARTEVVLSHGYAEHSGRYEHVAAALGGAGARVWALDHYGHGRSAGERADISSLTGAAEDLHLLVAKAAASGKPTYLVGHSMGGAIAVAHALAHQDALAGLVLSAPMLILSDELMALASMDEIPDVSLAQGISRDPEVVAAYESDPLVYLGPPPKTFLSSLATLPAMIDRLGELTLPMLVMHGSADPLIKPETLRALVARSGSEDLAARLWPGLLHEIFNEPEKDAVIGTLVRWITERVAHV